ncbi:cytochrome b562 [Salmonella enterica subsp. enterica serovar Poona]|nr:cytochrome b562 [Salmonella enterica subsp. enterica serovar Poona]HEB6950216.1 cytochrome b562 [Salmonella enterica subsp. enterica serovar Hvittingfoss]
MRKALMILITGTLLTCSVHAFAADLDDDMDILAQNLGTAQTAIDAAKMNTALSSMRGAALDAQKAIPAKLEGKAANSAEMKDYRHGLDILVEQIDHALSLVHDGNISEAQKVVNELKVTRDTYHHKYR